MVTKKYVEVEIPVEFPTQEEINGAYERYKEHESHLDDIRSYKGVSKEEDFEIYKKEKKFEKEGISWDWTDSGIDHDPGSVYYLSKYGEVYKLNRILKDKKILKDANAGLLILKDFTQIFKKHPLTCGQYYKIDEIVREAYFNYLGGLGRKRLESDRKELIDGYIDTLDALKKALERKDSDEKYVSFRDYASSFEDNVGVMRIKEKSFDIFYSPFCYDYQFYAANKAIPSIINKDTISEAHEAIRLKLEEIENMSIEEYRDYKTALMKLHKLEIEKYGRDIEAFNYAYIKRINH